MAKKQDSQLNKAPGSFSNQGPRSPKDAAAGPEERYQQAKEQAPTGGKPGAKRTNGK